MPRVIHALLAGMVLAGMVLALAASPGAAQVSPLGAHPVEASRAVSRLIAARDAEAGADFTGRLMGGGASRDKLMPIMKQMMEFGPNQYVDRIYARAFGTSSYDIIDKLNFDNAIVFVRYVFHVERGEWQLVNFVFKAETSLPLPRDWIHVYPDGLAGPGKP